ncbi:hypothetical protein [Kiloniella majae]|uniref:hypothetical protein n=1 Tax=Kiloniella majae TaxID=1938558 RepID=UPI000A277D00|nr:hypothetical protein [Kiloniella majae]
MSGQVLFVISIFNYHREVEPIVDKFIQGGWEVDVLLGWQDQDALIAEKEYISKGANVIWTPFEMAYGSGFPEKKHFANTKENIAKRQETLPYRLQDVKKILKNISIIQFAAEVLFHHRRITRLKEFSAQILDRGKYDIVFQGPFHSVGKLDNTVYTLAKQRNLPNYCYPVSAYHGRSNAIMSRKQNISAGMVQPNLYKDNNFINRIIAFIFPHWLEKFEGKVFFLSHPSLMYASYLQGVELEDIWAKPQPGFDSIFVFSNFSKSLLDDGRFPMEKVQVCGVPLLDKAIMRLSCREEEHKLYDHINLTPDDNFILLNVEPSFEHHYCEEEIHWKRFDQLMKTVSEIEMPVVLSLHPLCNYNNYKHVIKEYGFNISSDYKIHDLYPFCSLVLSFACSTNIFAEMFGKPLVIYDFFDLTTKNSPRAAEFRLPNAKFCYNFQDIKIELSKIAQIEVKEKLTSQQTPMASDKVFNYITNLPRN